MINYAVIMAGGGGTRFWPLSRQTMPKQLLNLSGRETMVNETIDRIANVIDKDNIFIVTNHVQWRPMAEVTTGRIDPKKILSEPAARNTAACIGYAAMEVIKKYGDGVMCIFPADHYIKNEAGFADIMRKAISVAEAEDKLVTVGITPTFPSTGYGYIKFDKNESSVAKKVEKFVEKPSLDIAKEYVASGNYAWNSGMFVWRASVILDKFKELLPDVYSCINEIGAAMGTVDEEKVINEVYPTIPKISVDYGIMEKADNVVVIDGEFGWNDVGSWDTLGVMYTEDESGNIQKGGNILVDTKNSVIFSDKRLIATVGLENVVVVETDDAILVCDKNKAQDVKKVVDILKEKGMDQYL